MKFYCILGFVLLMITGSCRKCKDCYLIEDEGLPAEVTNSLGAKCGKELKDIDGKTYTGLNGPARSYCQ